MTRNVRLSFVACGLLATGAFFGNQMQFRSGEVAAAQREEVKEHADEDHEKRQAALRKAMSGPVDIYFDIAQIEADKPMIRNAKYVDLVDVTGKDLLRFADVKGQEWLVDPDTVLTFCIKSKTK